jgi:hypothetical protein
MKRKTKKNVENHHILHIEIHRIRDAHHCTAPRKGTARQSALSLLSSPTCMIVNHLYHLWIMCSAGNT